MLKETLLPAFKLCLERGVASMTSIVSSLNVKDAKDVDKYADWSAASHWASWWTTNT